MKAERKTVAKLVASAKTHEEKEILAGIGGERPKTAVEAVALAWHTWNINSPMASESHKTAAMKIIENITGNFMRDAMERWKPAMLRDLANEMTALTKKNRQPDRPLQLLLDAQALGPVNVTELHKDGVKNGVVKISLRAFQEMATRHKIPTAGPGRPKKQCAD